MPNGPVRSESGHLPTTAGYYVHSSEAGDDTVSGFDIDINTDDGFGDDGNYEDKEYFAELYSQM